MESKFVKPYHVRIAIKSLNHSYEKLEAGIFNKSGMGSRAYHLKNVQLKTAFVEKHKHLLNK